MMIIIDGCHCPRAVNPRPFSEGYPISHYMAAALIGEFSRVVAWHARFDPDTDGHRSWLSAMRAAAENPPGFDRMWDEAFEDGPLPWYSGGSVDMWADPNSPVLGVHPA